ncbi:MAG: hypothetical protein KF701_03225 [Anaerolineales bacterium]|nr:MAG: hypothetical protein KF701_03225 [Anaerolineales bacterium]
MKSLSILVLLGTLSAIILGAFFAITPARAQDSAPAVAAASQEQAAVVAPVTGSQEVAAPVIESAAPAAEAAAVEPGAALAQTFTVNLQKDTSSPVIEAELAAPETAAKEAAPAAQAEAAPAVAAFSSFVNSVSNGNGAQVTGIYVDGVMAYGVVGQGGNAAFVSEQPNVVTQFGLASQYGSQGFLAHNYLAGGAFANIGIGQTITLVYGDGSTRDFQVTGTQSFQALSPDSTQSNFVDLNSGEQITASTLFHKVYNNKNSLVLQTCIEQDGISTWGRLFITAVPLS